MRDINLIIIHCSATKSNMNIGAKEIRNWHVKDNGWNDIGYHGVIRRDGTYEPGRSMDIPGAHCKGHNAKSIGMCLVGGLDNNGKPTNNFTPAQWQTLARVITELAHQYPGARIAGHSEFANKACPCFNVPAWWATVKADV